MPINVIALFHKRQSTYLFIINSLDIRLLGFPASQSRLQATGTSPIGVFLMNLPLILNLLVFLALLFGLAQTRHSTWSLAKKVLLALVLGVVFGTVLHTIYGAGNPVLKASISWFDLVGNGYVQLLQMIVIPLVFASILSAVARLHNASSLGKISFLTIGTLLFTTAIAALIGIGLTNLFGLTAEGLGAATQEIEIGRAHVRTSVTNEH